MTCNEMAKKLLKEAESNGRSSINVEKAKLTNLRASITTMSYYAGVEVATRYNPENSIINVFLVN